MKILVVDDTKENLKTAKLASENFSEHEFTFLSSAKEAASVLSGFDAVITDLFFPREIKRGETSQLKDWYKIYCSNVNKGAIFEQVCEGYSSYKNNRVYADLSLEDTRSFLRNGTIRKILERMIRESDDPKYLETLRSLPPAQFPYGGAIMLFAKDLGKKLCLVSDIHRHRMRMNDAASSIDAIILLMPLVSAGILTVKQVGKDGTHSYDDREENWEECPTYMGMDAISHYGKSKTEVSVWEEAIKRIVSQSV
jgi:hypothetical protein